MSLSTVGNYISLSWRIFLVNLQTAMSFKWSFVLEIIGVIAFYGGQFFLWTTFFKQFPCVGGWTYQDVMLVYSLFLFSFSLMDVFLGGINELAILINTGGLDYFIVFPKPILWHIVVSKSDVISLGVVVQSLTFFFYSGTILWSRTCLFLLASIFCIILLFNFLAITQSLAFFISGFDQGANIIRYQLMTIVTYPFSIFPKPFKYLLMTIIPSFFIITLPAQLISNFSWRIFGVLIVISILSSLLANAIFSAGLRRYESGNLIGTRV